jgi:DNA-directed RNA polymerase subunit RPC12/RpoP
MRPQGNGLQCPHCGSKLLAVKDSRPSINSIRRRRKCLSCGERSTTFEIFSPTTDEGSKLVSALTLFDRLRSIPDEPRRALLRMISSLATKQPPALPSPLIEPPAI